MERWEKKAAVKLINLNRIMRNDSDKLTLRQRIVTTAKINGIVNLLREGPGKTKKKKA